MGGGADNRFHIASRQEVMDEAYRATTAEVSEATRAQAAEAAETTRAEAAEATLAFAGTETSNTGSIVVESLNTLQQAKMAVSHLLSQATLSVAGGTDGSSQVDIVAGTSGGVVGTTDSAGTPRNALDDGDGNAVVAGRLTVAGVDLAAVAIPRQPLVPATGITQAQPPQTGFTFPGTFKTFTLGDGVTATWICAGPDHNLWVTDNTAPSTGVWRLTTAGVATNFALPPGPSGVSIAATGITAGPDGNVWIAGNDVESLSIVNALVWRVTPDGTATAFVVDTGNQQPTGPGICAGSDGNVWTELSGTGQIARITPSGTVTKFTLANTPNGNPWQLSGGICSGPDGNLWTGSAYYDPGVSHIVGMVVVIDTSGVVRHTYPLGGTGVTSTPLGICTGPDGNFWITDEVGFVWRVTPAGVATPFSFAPAYWLAAGAGGDLWLTALGSNRIAKMTVDGTVTFFTGTAHPTAICSGPDGSLWVTAGTTNQVLMWPFVVEMPALNLTAGPLTVAGVSTVLFSASFNITPIGVPGDALFNEQSSFSANGGNALIGQLSRTTAIPMWNYAAGAMMIYASTSIQVLNVPDSTDAFDLGITITVINDTGTEVGTLTAFKVIAAHTSSGFIAASDFTFTPVTGTDLAWTVVVNDGILSSTAGGRYGMLIAYTAGWD